MIKKNKGLSAYMTVEASLLFPMIVFMLVIILYLILFKYNEVTVFQNAAIAALYGKDFSYTDEKKEELNLFQFSSIILLMTGSRASLLIPS